ncbi:MAG: immunoglobulin domain-containing protein [Verrucomicrobiales bacterium]|nr:immunoglobulin domain-containing protein [Verrucomicrobiales bacterium]
MKRPFKTGWRAVLGGILFGSTFGLMPWLAAQDLPTDGLMARWDFEEGAGTVAHDSSGNGNDGALDVAGSDAQWVAGRFGGGLAFTGQVDNRLIVPDSATIGSGLVNGFSVAAWFKPNTDLAAGGSGAALMEKGNAFFLLQGVASGGMNLLIKQGGANRTVPLGESLFAGTWYHIAGVFDGSEARIYLNGDLKGSLAVTAPMDDPALPLVIGGDDATRTFNGTLDQVALWNRALTGQEILQAAARVGPPTIERQPASMDVYAGGTAIFSVAAIGEDPLRYAWYKGDEPVRGETEATLVLEYVTEAEAGAYHVVVSNDLGSATSDDADLTVHTVTGLETARVLYLPFDETTGTTAADSSGNGNDGLLTDFWNDPWWGAGKVNNALAFAGSDVDAATGGFVTAADSASLDSVTHEATFSFWLKATGWGFPENTGNYDRSATYILRKGDHFGIRVINDPGSLVQTIVARANVGADNGTIVRHGFEANAPQGSLVLDEWQHWTVLYRNNTVTFYKNGFRVGEPATGSLGSPDDSALTIGAYDDLYTAVTTSRLAGSLDEVSVWGRPLSEAEILEVAGRDVSGAPVVVQQPASQKRIEGTTAFFEVFVTGMRPVTYQWLKDGQPIDGATGSTLTVPRLQPSDAGDYAVKVTNSQGSTTSTAATLEVEALDAITSGLVAYYPFDDGSGTTLSDLSGNNLNGTLYDMDDSVWVTGQIGGAIRFNDTTANYIEVAHNDLLNMTGELTVSVWLNPWGMSSANHDRVFRKDTNFDFVLLPNGEVRTYGIGKTAYLQPGGWELDTWAHFVYVYKNGTLQWYKNGEPLGDAIAPASIGELSTKPLVIGNYQAPPGSINRPYFGTIDDLGIWQRALSPTEILGIYVNGLAGKPLNEEFEPLHIKTIQAQGGVVELDYYTPFSNRPTQVESRTDLGAAGWTVAEATIVDKGQGNFTATIPVAGNETGFFRLAAVPPPPLFFDDFETAQAGWTHGGSGDNWERGVPTVGPAAAYSGENVYATGLGTNLQPYAYAWLRTPAIDLTGVSSATLSFAEWLNMDFIPGVPADLQYHLVMIWVLDADTETLLSLDPIYLNAGNSGGWQMREVRLVGGSVGARIKLEFQVVTDNLNLLEGWYLDDVTVRAN